MSSRRHSGGFTLIEVLIAVTAFAIVLTAINGVFYGALRLRNASAQSFERTLPVQHTLAIMRRDLANLVLPGGVLSGAFQSTPTTGLNSGSSSGGSGMRTSLAPGQASPFFYTATGAIDETSPFGEIEKVAYVLMDSTNRALGQELCRSVTRNLLATVEESPVVQPLLSGVQAVSFLYYDGTQWRNTWDSTTADPKTGQTNILPQAIKVQIALASELGGRQVAAPIELVVPVDVQARTNQTAQAEGGAQ